MKRMIDSEAWAYREFVLATGALAENGHMACLDTATGEVTPGATSATLIAIGWFDAIYDKLGFTGDGIKKVNVRLFRELDLAWWDNDAAPNDVQLVDVGHDCFIKDSTTVSMDATGRSRAGRIVSLSASKGVLVSMAPL